MCIEICISGEIIDIVVSNVPKKHAILAGFKIVMNQHSVYAIHKPLPLGLRPPRDFINRIQTSHLVLLITRKMVPIKKQARSYPTIVCHPA